ncbi:hypothetical protein A6A03_16250 [Chloroflexus islandicus]|uniref:Uncharacterized protein n=1 Tax=Chloroflexus islandicus TaxID=1707952 RepID=A0A178M736_9CHLR|nr:hypothetical protein A6A03_16250 [Chloroflexus islandicus]
MSVDAVDSFEMLWFALTRSPSPADIQGWADHLIRPPALKGRAKVTKPAARADAPTRSPAPAGVQGWADHLIRPPALKGRAKVTKPAARADAPTLAPPPLGEG